MTNISLRFAPLLALIGLVTRIAAAQDATPATPKSRVFLSKQFHEFPPLQPARRRSCAPLRRKENRKMLAYAAFLVLVVKRSRNSGSHR
jgi:hypothetical protein